MVEKFKEIAFSRYKRMITHLNSQRLWQYVQDLHKFNQTSPQLYKATQNTTTKTSLLTKMLFDIDISQERKDQFSAVACHWAYQTPQGRPYIGRNLANTEQILFCFVPSTTTSSEMGKRSCFQLGKQNYEGILMHY